MNFMAKPFMILTEFTATNTGYLFDNIEADVHELSAVSCAGLSIYPQALQWLYTTGQQSKTTPVANIYPNI